MALQSRSARRRGVYAEHEAGQNLRRVATNGPTVSDGRGALLRGLADDIARWRKPAKPKTSGRTTDRQPRPQRYRGAPRDDLLDNILHGRADLGQLTPVGALALPLLWLSI